MTVYTGYWLVYVNAASEEGPPQLTLIPVDRTDRTMLIRDAQAVLTAADTYHALHRDERVVFFGEITRWVVKERQMTWGELHVDFEIALAHLDTQACNLVVDADPVTAAIIATPADNVIVGLPGGTSIPVDKPSIKRAILAVVDADIAPEVGRRQRGRDGGWGHEPRALTPAAANPALRQRRCGPGAAAIDGH